MRKKTVVMLLLAWATSMLAQGSWHERFRLPDKAAEPWTFWYWMYGAVSDDGIRLDLQAMKDAGIAGFYLMPIKDVSDGSQYGGTARQLSPEWWKRMRTAYQVADSLGLQMGIHFSDGFALGGGPWITPEESMQRVVWSDTLIEVNEKVRIRNGRIILNNKELSIQVPEHREGYYEDIGMYAVRVLSASGQKPQVSETFPFRSTEPCDILFTYEKPFTLRQVKIVTGGNNYQAHRWQVSASDDGITYRFIRNIEPARQGWQNTDAQATYSIPATTAKYFKFHWTPDGSDPGSEDMDAAKWKPALKVADIVLGDEPVIDGYEGKSGAVWRVSQSITSSTLLPPPSTICLSSPNQVTLPPGRWRILRMGHTTTGHTNATGGGGKGLECDKFSRMAIRKQLAGWFGAIRDSLLPSSSAPSPLTRLHVDSWECGSQNWSKNFADEFARRRGYDLLPWMPVYAGIPMESMEKSDSVLRDIRQTIAELIDEIFFDEVEQAARRYGVSLSTESVAPTMVSDGLLHYRHADYPMGEFWLNSPTHDKPNDMLDAISGAHIYGKNIVQAEGFTEVRGTWDETPAMLKPLLDRSFCLGINGIVFHVNTHNPWTDRRPGMTLDGIGTFFQRDNTWWPEMPAFTNYIKRCQSLLQYGRPVVELAVYTGDEVPRRAILPERLTTTLPGLYGDSLLNRERERLANIGQPMETSPVGVNHTRNMTKAEDWINPLHGYKYDSFNHDVLNTARVENGQIVTKGGMHYDALVIPQARNMNPDNINTAQKQIERLRRQGARVIDQPWTEKDLCTVGILPDAILPTGIDYIHRQGENTDIYFLCNQTERAITFTPVFREIRAYSYLADAMTGNIYPFDNGITLSPFHSIFYVTTDTPVDNITPTARKQEANWPLRGQWKVTFLESEPPRVIVTDSLFDWSQYETDYRIKYYSGHASYETTFHYKGIGVTTIDLGEVRDVATVYVNGICCGTSWLSPHRLDISKAIRKGWNQLKIVVVNTWANALQGADNGTPPFSGIWTNGKYRRGEKELLPAGLLGPVIFK